MGTRPEALKLIPLYKALIAAGFTVRLCATFQHRELLTQMLELFNVTPDINLSVMQPNQSLEYITTAIINGVTAACTTYTPDLIIVQGDTTTAFAASLAAFYQKIPVAHVEAGLRTTTPYQPFPEEMNRRLISRLATYHFAPTHNNVTNLIKEGIQASAIFCTGNTIVDTLQWVTKEIVDKKLLIDAKFETIIHGLEAAHKKILVLTTHRRESFGQGLKNIFESISTFASRHDDVAVIFPMHPNPAIKEALKQSNLHQTPNVFCINPLAYPEMIFLMSKAHIVVTDSGGIQEEAVSLGKKTLVLRTETERQEGIHIGMAHLVGTDKEKILSALEEHYTISQHITPASIYGLGDACSKIVSHLLSITHNSLPSKNVILNDKGIV